MPFDPPPANAPTRFQDRAADYALSRPDYPDDAIAAALELLREGEWAADIGAGTGISSRQLADRGARVFAVEPNPAMRAAGASVPHPRIMWVASEGERTTLPDESVGLVVCAQAFHWLRAPEAVAEFRRILRPGGRVALLWNVQDATDPATRAYRDAVKAHATESPRSPWAVCTDGGSEAVAAPLAEHPSFADFRTRRYPHQQRLTEHGLLARAMSASYTPREGPARDALAAELRAAFARHAQGGFFRLRYTTELHTAERSA